VDRSTPESAGEQTPAILAGNDRLEFLPLAVDLDGTLVATDTLLESALSLIRQRPSSILLFLVWFSRGKAVLKAEISRRVTPHAESLPYRRELVEFLRGERNKGRTVVLATAAHRTIADSVAASLGIFDVVLASTDAVNLKGTLKRDALVRLYGSRGFDYIGDSKSDNPVWAACRIGHVVGPMRRLPRSVLAAGTRQGEAFSPAQPGVKTWLREIRVYQWVKNLLVFVPALINHHFDAEILMALVIAFLGFSFLASGTYVINDIFDLEADRRHPRKSRRPLASGQIPIAQGILMATALLAAGILLGLTSLRLAACLFIYLVLTLLYSSYIKGKPIIDVVVLAMLYTLRVYAGGLVSRAYVSPWLFQFSIFLFLSLAFVKRYSELERSRLQPSPEAHGRGYRVEDLSIIGQAGLGSGLLAGLVLALYVNGQDTLKVYPHPEMLWGVCPLFVYWIVRVWLVAHRGNMHEDPILFAFRDRVSYIVAFLIVVLVILGLLPRV
jgi:4-hydroxybenzoate polyprenyltransferase/phosphoserine phosphatase